MGTVTYELGACANKPKVYETKGHYARGPLDPTSPKCSRQKATVPVVL